MLVGTGRMPPAQSITLQKLTDYFHLPINIVAKELGVCATVLKKICRKNGIPRWPHRKIKSLDKMIRTLESTLGKSPEDDKRVIQEIVNLKNKKIFLINNPNILAAKANKMSSRPCHKPSKPGKVERANFKISSSKFIHLQEKESSSLSTYISHPSHKTLDPWCSQPPFPLKKLVEETSSLSDSTDSRIDPQQEEAATSLLNVFISLTKELQEKQDAEIRILSSPDTNDQQPQSPLWSQYQDQTSSSCWSNNFSESYSSPLSASYCRQLPPLEFIIQGNNNQDNNSSMQVLPALNVFQSKTSSMSPEQESTPLDEANSCTPHKFSVQSLLN